MTTQTPQSPYNPKVLTPEFESYLLENGYTHIRELEDGSVAALHRLLFTTGLCVDLNQVGWASRYCFEDKAKAIEQLALLKDADSVPQGFVARRGREPENR